LLVFTGHLANNTLELTLKLCLHVFHDSDTGSKAAGLISTLSDDGLLAPSASALTVALEHAAAAVARLDAALLGHPLAAAWAYRARLDAIRRQAAADGQAIDPWHLAALVEGVRLRLDSGAPLIDRGAILDAARHTLALYRWYSRPDDAQHAAISAAAAHLTTVADIHAPLLGAAYAIHAWLDRGGERPPLRAALATYWVRRGVTVLPCPLLTGAAALAAEVPWTRAVWVGHFLDAIRAEAVDGLALLRLIERSWWHARRAVAGRRRDSHAAAAIDLLAAAPLLSATALAQLLGIAIKNAIRLLDGLVGQGLVSEMTHRSKRRLYGLTHLAPLRAATTAPRRPSGTVIKPVMAAAAEPMGPLVSSPPLLPLERRQFDFSNIDQLLDRTDQAIRRVQNVLAIHQSAYSPFDKR
jgi:hypothetical protein